MSQLAISPFEITTITAGILAGTAAVLTVLLTAGVYPGRADEAASKKTIGSLNTDYVIKETMRVNTTLTVGGNLTTRRLSTTGLTTHMLDADSQYAHLLVHADLDFQGSHSVSACRSVQTDTLTLAQPAGSYSRASLLQVDPILSNPTAVEVVPTEAVPDSYCLVNYTDGSGVTWRRMPNTGDVTGAPTGTSATDGLIVYADTGGKTLKTTHASCSVTNSGLDLNVGGVALRNAPDGSIVMTDAQGHLTTTIGSSDGHALYSVDGVSQWKGNVHSVGGGYTENALVMFGATPEEVKASPLIVDGAGNVTGINSLITNVLIFDTIDPGSLVVSNDSKELVAMPTGNVGQVLAVAASGNATEWVDIVHTTTPASSITPNAVVAYGTTTGTDLIETPMVVDDVGVVTGLSAIEAQSLVLNGLDASSVVIGGPNGAIATHPTSGSNAGDVLYTGQNATTLQWRAPVRVPQGSVTTNSVARVADPAATTAKDTTTNVIITRNTVDTDVATTGSITCTGTVSATNLHANQLGILNDMATRSRQMQWSLWGGVDPSPIVISPPLPSTPTPVGQPLFVTQSFGCGEVVCQGPRVAMSTSAITVDRRPGTIASVVGTPTNTTSTNVFVSGGYVFMGNSTGYGVSAGRVGCDGTVYDVTPATVPTVDVGPDTWAIRRCYADGMWRHILVAPGPTFGSALNLAISYGGEGTGRGPFYYLKPPSPVNGNTATDVASHPVTLRTHVVAQAQGASIRHSVTTGVIGSNPSTQAWATISTVVSDASTDTPKVKLLMAPNATDDDFIPTVMYTRTVTGNVYLAYTEATAMDGSTWGAPANITQTAIPVATASQLRWDHVYDPVHRRHILVVTTPTNAFMMVSNGPRLSSGFSVVSINTGAPSTLPITGVCIGIVNDSSGYPSRIVGVVGKGGVLVTQITQYHSYFFSADARSPTSTTSMAFDPSAANNKGFAGGAICRASPSHLLLTGKFIGDTTYSQVYFTCQGAAIHEFTV